MSNFTHVEPTFVELGLFEINIFRTSLTLDGHVSKFIYFGPRFVELTDLTLTFVELDPFWLYVCRTSLFFRLSALGNYLFLLGSVPDHPDHHPHGGRERDSENGTSSERVWNKKLFSRQICFFQLTD